MSAFGKKLSPSKSANTRPSASLNTPSARASASTAPSVNGVGRSPSVTTGLSRPARGAVKRPSPNTSFLNMGNNNVSDEASEDDARAENASLMEELKNRLRKAETASEEYQRQLSMLQTRLEDSVHEQGKLEDQMHENSGRLEELENEKSQASRQKREMEDNFDSERTAMGREKIEQRTKEEELLAIIQRLKETLAQREMRINVEEDKGLPRSPSFRSRSSQDIDGQFAPPSTLQRSDSKNNSKLVMQKDRIIESLRLELAEAQIKIVEMENMGGGRMHEMEKTLLETRITNARLMEDNESFQLLLSEKTLNGDFSKTELMHGSSGLGSLAEELESAEGESDNYRRLEVENKSLRDQNKALTLYVENIIGRLLQHKEFENLLDKTPDLMSGKPRPPDSNKDKDLPPPPPPPAKDGEVGPTILQRAKSVVAGSARRPRPMSLVPPPVPTPVSVSSAVNEDPSTAPSIPLGRSHSALGNIHRRSQSDMPNPAPLVNQMYRGPPSTGSGGPLTSPNIGTGVSHGRTSFFSPAASAGHPSAPSSRVPSSSRVPQEGPGSSSNSTFSGHSAEIATQSSPPRTNNARHSNNYTGAIMTQNKLRPLRLVQENKEVEPEEDAIARKKANRASWMPGWFNRAKEEDAQRNSSAENNVF